MKLVASVGFGLAFALSALAFSGTQASALEAPAVPAVSQNGIVKVHWHSRCQRVRYKCGMRFGPGSRIFRYCVHRRGCGL